jgi:hypothetical protein
VETHPASSAGSLQLLLLLALLVPALLFLLTQQNTLKLIRPENRQMAPGLVWLQLIPVFGQVWQFFVISRLSRSIKSELESPRGDSILGVEDVLVTSVTRKQPTRDIGISYSILYWLMLLVDVIMVRGHTESSPSFLMFVGLLGWASIICWIVYWAKLAWYKRKLKVLLVLA